MQKEESKILCLVAGGSGGHIIPALTLGEKWKEENPGGSILFFVNTVKDLDLKIINQSDRVDRKIFIKLINIPGKKLWLYPKFLFQFFSTFIKSLLVFYQYKPEEIISTGGHISLPICLTAFLSRIPINIYELNFVPGKAIKALSLFATNIFMTFEKSNQFFGAQKDKCHFAKYPIKYSEKDLLFDKSKVIKEINSGINSNNPSTHSLSSFAQGERNIKQPISLSLSKG